VSLSVNVIRRQWHCVWCIKEYVELPPICCIWIFDASCIARRENIAVQEKWETTRPPTSHSRGLPVMLEMVFASRYVTVVFTSNVTFTITCVCYSVVSDMRRNCHSHVVHVTVVIIRYCSEYLASTAYQWQYLLIDRIFLALAFIFWFISFWFIWKIYKYGII